ncbi:helicase, putative, RecD/TraA family [Desulfitobacterium dehalogenans ATCC 51507]|uniref:ATP-dependent RecD2 DNA helicase n=1 Tax=Desulfitobacterium dehalogenans (strain ATCC 51507 / DSM 9161 / JW/IU-DC1) TaxID=756499 RepID=I4A6B0_DESDJ|nr:ATP-dependent RecD-like DNA helicase [Desulfitobacterium dehalogenans]AFL99494.1 helicase, putative, RecD/TraA family [Desulfitobacterium dehalogenans ATCC 51507]
MATATAARMKKGKETVKPVATLAGKIISVRFHNPQNGYSVISIEPKDMVETGMVSCSAVGNLAAVRVGDEYEFAGEWKEHPQYGRQFAFCKADVVLPKEKTGAATYLATLAYGVGFAKAKRIVDRLGDDALNRIIEAPALLDQFHFLSPQQREEIQEGLLKNTRLAELAALICKEGVGIGTATRIFNTYGQASVSIVKENPYVLADEVYGIGFKVADRIGMGLSIAPDSPYRVESAYMYALREAGNDGHVYLTPKDTIVALDGLLGKQSMVGVSNIKDAYAELEQRGLVCREGDAIYVASMLAEEKQLARDIVRLAQMDGKYLSTDTEQKLEEVTEAMQAEFGVIYAPEQKEAIKKSFYKSLSVVTGGPGTGKTTVIKGIIEAYRKIARSNLIMLAAPTGRAAKRMTEATGCDASTIHRLLKFNPMINGFEHDADNQLPAGLLIVDEYSMSDLHLAKCLFEAVPSDMLMVIVGDVDQLPSVGPGKVLEDIIESRQVITTRLKFNYRQASGSRIALEASRVVEFGECRLYQDEKDWKTILEDEPEKAVTRIKAEVRAALAQGLGIMDFQVLAPMKKGLVGVDNLNEVIREIVNPPDVLKPEKKTGKDKFFRLGDKIMVIRNNYKLGVFNGDIGVIQGIDSSSIAVDFEGEMVTFSEDNINDLTLAYASTIHKSQGSEFPLVIMIIMRSHYIMLQKNLFYTGFTRAKQRLVLVCQESAVKRCLDNAEKKERHTLLRDRIIAYAGASQSA